MTKLRPYLVDFQGKLRLVQATTQGVAQNHVIKAEVAKVRAGIKSCRAATGSDVAAFFAAGGTIETAGEPVPARSGGLLARLQVGTGSSAIIAVSEGDKIRVGDMLSYNPETGKYRRAEAGDDLNGAVRVPDDFKINAAGDTLWWGEIPEDERDGRHSELCPGHVASEADAKVCGRCGVNIAEFRPEPDEQER